MVEIERDGVAGRFAERAVGERSESAGVSAGASDPELVERPQRRTFTAEYKLRILKEAEACTRPGEIGALLRREGLYSGHLSKWRRQREAGALEALERPRGRKPVDRRELELVELRRRAERAEAELAKARKVIEIQGNVSALLEQMLATEGVTERASTGR
jgi:transposase